MVTRHGNRWRHGSWQWPTPSGVPSTTMVTAEETTLTTMVLWRLRPVLSPMVCPYKIFTMLETYFLTYVLTYLRAHLLA